MKMFYISATKYENSSAVLCQDVAIEYVGYDGACLDRTFEFAEASEVNGSYAGTIVILTEAEVSTVKEMIEQGYKGKEYVAGCSAETWKGSFQFVQNISFKEVEIKF